MLAFFLFFRCGWKLERKRVKRCSKVLILNSSVINGLGAKSKMCLQLGSIADFLGRLSTSVDISLYLVLVLLHSSSSFNSLKIQLVASASFFSFFKLEYNCFTMLCSFLLYSELNQLCVHIYPLSLGPPCHPTPIPTMDITEHWAELSVLYSRFPVQAPSPH